MINSFVQMLIAFRTVIKSDFRRFSLIIPFIYQEAKDKTNGWIRVLLDPEAEERKGDRRPRPGSNEEEEETEEEKENKRKVLENKRKMLRNPDCYRTCIGDTGKGEFYNSK